MLINQTYQGHLKNPEFQSAIIRLAIWLAAFLYIGLGAGVEHYQVNLQQYGIFFGVFLLLFLGILVSVIHTPVSWPRRYFSLGADILAVTLCIYMTNQLLSPFFLFYIWIFISYGTRYGKTLLKAASLLSILSYSALLIHFGAWQSYTFESVSFLLLLVVLPLYQNNLLRQLHEARQRAERLAQAKTDFLEHVTDELRTPLAGIMGMTSLLRGAELGAGQRTCLASIEGSAKLLNAIIGDLLDLSRIERGHGHPDRIRFDPAEVVREVGIALGSLAGERAVEINYRCHYPDGTQLLGDRMRFKQILFNLLWQVGRSLYRGELLVVLEGGGDGEPGLKVAIEASGTLDPKAAGSDSPLGSELSQYLIDWLGGSELERSWNDGGCRIHFSLPFELEQEGASSALLYQRLAGRTLLLYEQNDGLADLLEQQLNQAGLECVRVSDNIDLAEKVDQLARCNGLDVAVLGDTPQGTDLVRLASVIRAHISPQLPVLYLSQGGRWIEDGHERSCQLEKPVDAQLVLGMLSQLLEGSTEPVGSGVDLGYRVLVAEDNAINGRVLSHYLEQLGCVTLWVGDGRQALMAWKSQEFDVALIDLMMPIMDGAEFTRQVRAAEHEGEHLPVIAVTANDSENARRLCREAGMDRFLVKPVDPGVLRQQLIELVRGVSTI